MANNGSTSMHESASFWIVASGVLGVLGLALIGTTAGKVGKADVSPIVLAFFALGCLVLLGAIASLFWGLVLFVAARRPVAAVVAPTASAKPVHPIPVTPPAAALPKTPRPKAVPKEMATHPAGPDELTGVSADDLIAIRKENTAVRAQSLLKPYVGKWLTLTSQLSELETVEGTWNEGCELVADLREDRKWQARAFFRREWQDRLSTIPLGSAITVRGKVRSVSDVYGAMIYECELL